MEAAYGNGVGGQEQQKPEQPKAPQMWRQFPGVTATLIIAGWCGIGIDFQPAGPQAKIRLCFITIILSACNNEGMVYAAMFGLQQRYAELVSKYNQLCIMRGVKQEKTRGGIIMP